ncbi:substrate-binding domain-containing protein [Oscillospiraceae bacterium 50-16]
MRRFRTLTAALALSLLLTACGQTSPAQSRPSSSSSSASGSVSAVPAEEFVFTRANLPRLDGSTSTVPLAQAMCAVLLGEDQEQTAQLIHFSRTTQSYYNLMNGNADLLLAAEPTPEVMEELDQRNIWYMTPFAIDALVFVVNQNNPVDSLTVEEVQKIYTGEITNWSQVGGEDLDIVPFQRNKGAGSQNMFEKLVMDGRTPMDPPSTWTADSMSGLLDAVREYDNSAAALGYTVYYYANDMEMARGLKVLAIDGVSPSAQAIRDQEYPFLNPYFVVIPKDLPRDDPARILYDWVLGPDGQKLAALEGYVPVTDSAAGEVE